MTVYCMVDNSDGMLRDWHDRFCAHSFGKTTDRGAAVSGGVAVVANGVLALNAHHGSDAIAGGFVASGRAYDGTNLSPFDAVISSSIIMPASTVSNIGA